MVSRDELVGAFAAQGFQLWVVGGSVRDALLGRSGGDQDYATDALPDDIEQIGRATGTSINPVGKRFGTIGLMVDGEWSEITTFRGQETYATSSRWPEVVFGTSIEEDLARRDFTMNAIARDAATGAEMDPYGGRDDIAAGLIRAVGVPVERFEEDPLRILRGIRFAAQLGFTIEPATFAGMQETIGLLTTLSIERITSEFDKLLVSDHPAVGLELLREAGALPVILPELQVMVGCEQNRFHRYDVWGHTVATVAAIDVSDARRLRRWTALAHDVGKPPVRHMKDNGEWGFYQHEVMGEKVAHTMLERLRVGRVFANEVALLVRRHMDRPELENRKSVRRFIVRAEGHWRDLVALKRADNASHTYDDNAYHDRLAALCESVAEEDAAALEARSPLSGDDLMTLFGRQGGPWISRIKDRLSQAVLDGELEPGDREGAVEMARAMRNSGH